MESEGRFGSHSGEKFSGEIAKRLLRRAGELRDENAHTLGRLVGVLRKKREMSRVVFAQRARLHPQWVAMLEQELLGLSDLSRARLGRLGGALGVAQSHPDIFLAEASGIDYEQLPERARPIGAGVRITR